MTSPETAGPDVARPTVSFLTTAYRSEDTVGRTISAVLAQTRPDWELVVVDNGNAQTMLDAVSPYLDDPRIQLVRQENRGAAGGQMRAAAHARGDYLVVLNSDDYITPDFTQRMCDFLERHPGVAAVTCDAALFVDPGAVELPGTYLQRAGIPAPPDPTRPLRVSEVIDGPCPYYTAPIRRDVWDALGGMSGLGGDATLVDDLDFWLRALTAGYDVRMLPDVLGHFRIEAGSVSRPVDPAKSEEHEDQLERSLRRAADRSGEPEAHEALARSLNRLHYWQSVRRARVAIQAGRAREAREHYRTALRLRRTVRSTTLYLALRLAPGLSLQAYRLKMRLRGTGPGQPGRVGTRPAGPEHRA